MTWTVYILACVDNTYYTGIALDLAARLEQHAQGQGAKYTRGRGPYRVVYREEVATRSLALKREAAIKVLTRKEKEALIAATKPAKLTKRKRPEM